jgi:hypothetical protein
MSICLRLKEGGCAGVVVGEPRQPTAAQDAQQVNPKPMTVVETRLQLPAKSL